MYRPSVSVGPCREQDSSPAGKPVSSIESHSVNPKISAAIAVHSVRAISLSALLLRDDKAELGAPWRERCLPDSDCRGCPASRSTWSEVRSRKREHITKQSQELSS